ncbi:hypothetical protein D918_08080 [Trichuris suis]|nr:hypothetical protein D918_08080 [Trichuris suis]
MAISAAENNAQPSAESPPQGSVPIAKVRRLRPKRYYPYYYGHGWWPGYYSSWYSPWYGDSWSWWWW